MASTYIKGIMMTSCIAIIMTTSLNLTIGVLGQLTLGCCGFEAIGAYSAALLSKLLVANGVAMDPTLRFLLTTLAGGVVACIFGILVGIPALRLHGDYLAIITLGFGEIIRVIIQNLKVAGGMGLDKGAAGQALIGIDRLANLYVVFWITVVTVVLLFMFARSRYGRAVKAIRDDEIAASASGINITYMKVLVFAISAFFAGIAGGIFAQYIGSLNPTMAGWLNSINYVIMVVFGGMGSLTGSIVSAIGLTILPLVSTVISFLSMKVSMDTNKINSAQPKNDQMERTNKTMLWTMPLMSLWIGFTVPAGLSIYWIAQYLVNMIQELICAKLLKKDYEAARVAAEEQARQAVGQEKEAIGLRRYGCARSAPPRR